MTPPAPAIAVTAVPAVQLTTPPRLCNCNYHGTFNGHCDNIGQCSCFEGYDGLKCSKCEPNWSGFPKCERRKKYLPKNLSNLYLMIFRL